MAISKWTGAVLPLAVVLGGAGVASAGAPVQGTTTAPASPVAPSPPAVPPSLFPSPEGALQALAAAGQAKDRTALAKLFGSQSDDLLSGDPIEDANDLEEFHADVQEAVALRKDKDNRYTVLLGKKKYPFPLPIVQQGAQWLFDTKAGLDELFSRRIGENELSAIETCRAYVLAQWEYFTEGDHDNDSISEYAQRLLSRPGERDGLYWETTEGEKPSPFGKFISDAKTEGYSVARRADRPAGSQSQRGFPYHGYHFRVLRAQGPHAPGGAYNYIINGNMIAGYAFVAYPDKWGASGIMTFIVNQQGRVYQKNLGAGGGAIAAAMTEYDPDLSWKLVAP